MQNTFRFDIPIGAFMKSGPDGKERRIGGVCTTDQMDKQMETVLQEGLDFDPFLKGGWFNDNHDASTDAVLGYPDFAELKGLPNGHKGWYVEGHLLKTDRANKIWELANDLQKHDRKLGFSVEGRILERDPDDPRKIKKAVVTEVAITKCPVNPGTALAVLAKSLSAGSAIVNPGASPGEGFPLRVESLENGHQADEEDEKKKKKKRRKLTKSEAIIVLKAMQPGLSDEVAELIVSYAQRHYPAA